MELTNQDEGEGGELVLNQIKQKNRVLKNFLFQGYIWIYGKRWNRMGFIKIEWSGMKYNGIKLLFHCNGILE